MAMSLFTDHSVIVLCLKLLVVSMLLKISKKYKFHILKSCKKLKYKDSKHRNQQRHKRLRHLGLHPNCDSELLPLPKCLPSS